MNRLYLPLAIRFHPVQRTKFLGGHRGDLSITQFALADDDNVSQQATKGGGAGLTLASQWKSQFDDSEETDNELKGDNLQSPEHKQRITVGKDSFNEAFNSRFYCFLNSRRYKLDKNE